MDIEVTSTEKKANRFISTLEAMGGSAGNLRLREVLGWQESTYDSAKRRLTRLFRLMDLPKATRYTPSMRTMTPTKTMA